jgi:PKD repeat protein
MSKDSSHRSRPLAALCVAATLFSLVAARPSFAKGCAEGSPVSPVPASLWGELKPASIISDASRYTGNQLSDSAYPQITAVDVENGFLFASYWSGFQIWDVNGANAATPVKKVIVDGWAGHSCRTPSGEFPSWPGCSEFDAWIWALDAPTGNDNMVALGGENPVGLALFNTTNKTAPTLTYQDPEHSIHQVYAATINNRAYAFAADYGNGIYVYDMTAAQGLNKCLDNIAHTACPGVYKGKFGGGAVYVHGIQVGAKSIVVTSVANGFGNPKTVDLWDASNPSAVVKLGSGYGASNQASGAALFSQGGQTYLGVRRSTALDIVDVSSCVSSACGSLPAPIKTVLNLRSIPESNNWKPVIASMSGNTPFLYLGHHDTCHDLSNTDIEPVGKEEYLFDVSNPSSPREVTPPQTISDAGKVVDYWSWYYSDTLRGYSNTAALGGKFNGKYFYRGGRTIFDVHEWTGGGAVAPSANFSWSPSDVFVGDNVTFTDTSVGSTSRDWTFPGGNPPSVSDSLLLTQSVTFTSVGTKAVTLNAKNAFGSDQETKNVVVLDPSPHVVSASSESSVPVCGTVNWTATGVSGRAPLTIAWSIKNDSNQQVATGTGNPFPWVTNGQVPSGHYTGTVTVTNSSGSVSATSPSMDLTPPGALPTSFTPANDPFTAGTVTFRANVAEATAWSWDFGDGQGYRTGAPYNVANPTFTYTAVGTYQVKVKVSNCAQPVPVESQPRSVTITQVQPLVASFQAECPFGLCGFSTNQEIPFTNNSLGNPDSYLYDWNHNSAAAGTCNPTGSGAVQASHTYTAAGDYYPCLKLTRGAETQVYVHPKITVTTGGGGGGGGGGQTPSITVNGPSTGTISTALSFTAGTSNCTPSSLGWSWNASGATVTANGNSATITWPSTGTKTVNVTNSSCAGATGSKTLSITDGSGGGGGGGGTTLTAAFTFTPATPNVGQAVSFSAASSVGSPTIFSWDFGDGQTSSGNSAAVNHTYTAGGNFTVKLEVGKQGAGCPFGVCSASINKVITVNGGPPPLVASFDTSAACTSDFAGVRCDAEVGKPVSFTSTTANATSHSWSFGDAGTASGAQASHTWTQNGTFVVTLTVGDGRSTAATSRTFIVTGQPIASVKSVILPWIAQTRGALVQSSDLYVLNPGTSPIDVSLTFLRRGTPETNPPKVTRTIQPGATLFVADVLRELFNRENIAGFVTVKVESGNVEPIITSFNTTFQENGTEFGQTVPGISTSTTGSPATAPGSSAVQNLVGLNDNSERLAYFGLSNPSEDSVSYTLRFFDNAGRQIGTAHDFVMTRFGQKQFQVKDIRTLFGVNDQDDYRIEIRRTGTTGLLFPYGSNLRTSSEDPSFVGVGSAATGKVFLVGALSTPGLNHSTWQTDVVLSNTANEVVLTDITFTGTGVTTEPTSTVHLTLQPGETRRLSDVIGQQWGIRNTVGVVTLDSNAPGGVFPIVQGESYENTNPNKRFGQSMPALTEARAAGANASQYLVGLRQDAKNRTTLWVFNPGSQPGVYDIVYLGLNGQELGRIENVAMGPGKLRQFSPSQHKLPAAGVTGGFTIQVRVKSGKVLATAQVINNVTNDPAYIQGETR